MRLSLSSIKRIAPQTFYGRTFLIFVVPFLCILSISTYVFYARHWDKVTSALASHVADAFAYHAQSLAYGGIAASEEAARTAQQFFRIPVMLSSAPAIPFVPHRDDAYLLEALKKRGFQTLSIQKQGEVFVLRVLIPRGILEATIPYTQIYLRTTDIFLMWYFGSHVLFLGIAWVFMNNQIRPLKDLARLAEALGKGHPPQGIRVRGAQEVRQVGMAFLGMRQRMDRFVAERLEMLAAISHDLKTPLTRMRLALALINHDHAQALRQDVDDMQTMIQSYLEFVETQTPERLRSLEIRSFLKSVLVPYTEHVTLASSERFKIHVQPLAFRRCLCNVLDNALKFGNKAVVSYRTGTRGFGITIDDDGIGLSESQKAMVFRPFYRTDQARNQNTPGTGLGLTIVQDIVHRHGGRVRLGTSTWGGLRVMIFIPW